MCRVLGFRGARCTRRHILPSLLFPNPLVHHAHALFPPPAPLKKTADAKLRWTPLSTHHSTLFAFSLCSIFPIFQCALPFASEVHGAPVFTPAFWCTLRYQWLGCPPPSHPPSYRSIFVVLFYRKQGYCFRLLRTTHFPISSLFSGIFCFTLFCAHGADPVTFLRASVVLFFVYYHPWAGFFHPLVRLLVYTPLPNPPVDRWLFAVVCCFFANGH